MEEIVQRMKRVNSCMRQAHSEILRKYDLTGPQFFLLKMIKCKGELTVSEIADEFEQDRPTISAMFNRLLDKELVCKIANNEDRRSFYIGLTPKGLSLVEDCFKLVKKETKLFFGILSKEELDTLGEILDKLARRETDEK